MIDKPDDTNKSKTIEPPWQVIIQPMMEEYKVLWTEMNNRWTQQQQIINMSWTAPIQKRSATP